MYGVRISLLRPGHYITEIDHDRTFKLACKISESEMGVTASVRATILLPNVVTVT